jgi:hypothetical protein
MSVEERMNRPGTLSLISLLAAALSFGPAAAEEKPTADTKPLAEAHQQTITVKPAANGCAVVLSTKVAKALGTPEGLGSASLGETGRERIGSIIACQCGARVESKECAQGGSCSCGPGETPAVVCN